MTDPPIEAAPRPPAPRRPSRGPWMVFLGLVALWTLYLAFFGPREPALHELGAPLLRAPNEPRRADYRWVLHDLDGRPVPFARFEGKPVFLNLWATWCPPCLEELPSIGNLADNAKLKACVFLCVATDESATAVRAYMRNKHWSFTVLRATDLPAGFATTGLPATFIIAPDGRVVAMEEGPAQWDDPLAVDFLAAVAAGGNAAPKAKP